MKSVANDTSSLATDYSNMTVAKLKALCKERGITGYSTMTKSELINILNGGE